MPSTAAQVGGAETDGLEIAESGAHNNEHEIDDDDNRWLWQMKLEHWLHSTSTELFLMGLLICDCVLVITIMIIDAHYYNGKANEAKDHLKQCRTYGFLKCEADTYISSEEPGYGPDFGDSELLAWEKRLHWCSVVILVIFAIEVTALIVAKGKAYFTDIDNWPFWMDFCVIWASLLVDLLATDVSLGFLIFVRLWRIVRVAHGQHHIENEHKKSAVDKVRSKLKAKEAAIKQNNTTAAE